MARSYVVKKGDTLARIAKTQLGDAKLFQEIADLNGLRDPSRIAVGQRLEIPTRRELAPPPPPAPPRPAPAAPAAPPARPSLPGLQPPHGLPAVLAEFGDIYARLREDGTLDPRWETEQLARAPLPFPIPLSWDMSKQVRNVYCHRKLVPILPAVFADIGRRGLTGKVRSFGGCFNFRAKRSGSKLSTHAWGIAIDLNPETNGMGQDGDMPPGIVAAIKSAGFFWGGDWPGRNKDPMHFQFCRGY
jgi:LysM repeat protein